MIETLIFSKDRACQCNLLLRSVRKNLPELQKIHLLYKATTKDFQSGYDKLQKEFPEIDFIKEVEVVADTKRIVAGFTEKHSLCLVDDAVIINEIEVTPTLSILNGMDIHCVSLRLSPHLPLTYTTGTENRIPKFERANVAGTILYKWEWAKQKANTDYAYPSCIDGHIYMTGFLKYMVENLKFTSVNILETLIDHNRKMMKPLMCCYEKTVCLTIPNNIVQKDYPGNKVNTNKDYRVENLNKKYLDGFIISTENIYGMENKAVHEEVEYIWIPNSK